MPSLMMRLRGWRDLEVLREWTGPDFADPDGEETYYGLHPLFVAFKEHYVPDETPPATATQIIGDRVEEIGRGERRLPKGVAERMFEVDRQQQENGCPDENIAGLVELLQAKGGEDA